MPFYQKLGEIPRKHHIWFHRNGAGPRFKNEGIYYEHVVTTEGFNEAFSIMYHLRPPTRVRSVKLLKCEELKKAADSPLRHHHLKTANIAAKGRSLQRPHSDSFQSGHDAHGARAPKNRTANSSIIRTAAPTRSSSSSKAAAQLRRFSENNVIARRITSSSRAASLTGSCPIRWKRKIISFSNQPDRCEFRNVI